MVVSAFNRYNVVVSHENFRFKNLVFEDFKKLFLNALSCGVDWF